MNIKRTISELTAERSPTPELISYQTTRRAIGWLGIVLPFVLSLGSYMSGMACDLQPSISHYYYTNMREVFVGVLCAVSLFLFTYKGHSRLDSMAANAAGLFALGVALFPTDIIKEYPCQHQAISVFTTPFHSGIHFTCAALFFITLAFMSLFLFTKSKFDKNQLGPQKRRRNTVYRVCGWIMLFSIVIIAVSKPVFNVADTSRITYWMEALALLSFGISWLTKGEVVFHD